MRYAIYSVSKNGLKKAKELKEVLREADIYTMEKYAEGNCIVMQGGLQNTVDRNFNMYEVNIFVMATGITVRMIADLIKSKDVDPAVLVVDEGGNFVISLLSGHLGGANEQCEKIANIIGAIPVVTTASDVGGGLAVDTLSQKLKAKLDSLESAKRVTSLMVNGERVLLNLPSNLVSGKESVSGTVVVSNRKKVEISQIIPENIVLGIGCRKGIAKEQVLKAVEFSMDKYNLRMDSIRVLASAWVKKEEFGLLEAAKELNKKVLFFDKEEIDEVEGLSEESEFVRKQIGVGGVSEPCAYLASFKNGDFIAKKIKHNGVTVSIYEEEFGYE